MLPDRQQPTRLLRPWDSPGKNTGVGCHFLLQCMKVKSQSEVAQSCLTLHDPMDCIPPGSSIHGILQARVLEWVAIAFSKIPAELCQILKDDVVKVLHSLCQQIWKPQQWPQDWKRSVFIPVAKKGNDRECSNYHTIALISHFSKCSKSFMRGFNSTWTKNSQMFKLDLKTQRNQRSNCQHLLDHRKSKRNAEEHLFLLHWLC